MIGRITIAAAIAFFMSPATALFSQEHPEHPKAGSAQKKVSTADISAGIKKNIDAGRELINKVNEIKISTCSNNNHNNLSFVSVKNKKKNKKK